MSGHSEVRRRKTLEDLFTLCAEQVAPELRDNEVTFGELRDCLHRTSNAPVVNRADSEIEDRPITRTWMGTRPLLQATLPAPLAELPIAQLYKLRMPLQEAVYIVEETLIGQTDRNNNGVGLTRW